LALVALAFVAASKLIGIAQVVPLYVGRGEWTIRAVIDLFGKIIDKRGGGRTIAAGSGRIL
jgi:hypothetical protein